MANQSIGKLNPCIDTANRLLLCGSHQISDNQSIGMLEINVQHTCGAQRHRQYADVRSPTIVEREILTFKIYYKIQIIIIVMNANGWVCAVYLQLLTVDTCTIHFMLAFVL